MAAAQSIDWTGVMTFYIPLVVSLAVHEWAHAWSAWRLGDDTAAREGRLTLNPMAHLDLIGTVLLPLFVLIRGSNFFFGWAKPVPVNPLNFHRGVGLFWGLLITSLAGPLSNLVLALLFALGARAADVFFRAGDPIVLGLMMATKLNVLLAIFNLLPVPPLDGHRLLPLRVQAALRPFTPVVFIAFLVAIYRYGHVLIVPVDAVFRFLMSLTLAIF